MTEERIAQSVDSQLFLLLSMLTTYILNGCLASLSCSSATLPIDWFVFCTQTSENNFINLC